MDGTVASRLNELCDAAKVSHESVSLAAGLAAGHIGLIISGRIRCPRTASATAIADALGVSLDWLIAGRGDAPDADAVGARVRALNATRRDAIKRARETPDAPRAA